MKRLIWLTLFSLVLCQLPAGAKQVNPSSDVGAAGANGIDEPPQAKDNPALSREVSEMALTMMFGLMVGTVLTMVLVPTFYSSIYRIASPAPSG